MCICSCSRLSVYPSTYVSIYLSIDRSISPQDWKRSYSARLLQFLNLTPSKTKQFCETSSFWTWRHPKRSNSARLPQFLNLTTSKTKQFCGTSSIFELDNIKNEAILRDFLQTWKGECRADGLVPVRFAIFPLHLSTVLRLPGKIDARSYEVLHLSRKIIWANLQIWCSKTQLLSGNQCPALLTALMNMTLVLRLPRKMHRFWKCYKSLMFCSLLARCTIPCACHAKRHLNAKKWSEHVGCF